MFIDSSGTVPVVSNSDPIGYIENGTGAQYLRFMNQATSGNRPLYKTNILNSLGCGLWDGAVSSLAMNKAWANAGAATVFIVIKNLDNTYGSHYLSPANPTSNSYAVLTGLNYVGNASIDLSPNGKPYGVIHAGDGHAASQGNLVNLTGFNIIEWTRDGQHWKGWVNGVPAQVPSPDQIETSTFGVIYMGGPDNREEWHMDGYICMMAHYTVAHNAQSRDAVRRGIANQFGVPNVFYSTNSPGAGAKWIRTFRRRGGHW